MNSIFFLEIDDFIDWGKKETSWLQDQAQIDVAQALLNPT